MNVAVRVLTPADAVAVRDLRLEGLRLSPENFGSSWEEEAPHPISWWEDRLGGAARWFGAEVEGELGGLTVVSLNPRMKLRHNADIGAVYVRECFRRRGVGYTLLQSAMEYMRTTEAKNATLTVSAHNETARKLYERFGFSVCGQLRRELNVNGSFSDELLMRTSFF